MRFTPLRAKGKHGHLMDRVRATVWPAVLRRSNGACEACGARGVTLEWAHLMGGPGTGAGLGAWANSEHLTAALCRTDHQRIDRHLDVHLAQRLRRDALVRLWQATHRFVEPRPAFTGTLDEARRLIAELESFGWTYSVEEQKPVRAE